MTSSALVSTISFVLKNKSNIIIFNLENAVYYDGHEREDVIAYRLLWSNRIMEYQKFSQEYDQDDVSVELPLELPAGTKQHVFVTHDESTFYSNDYQKHAWVENNESYCLPKSQGRSIMVSEFHCRCHGTMRATINGKKVTSRKIFYPGAANEGYWTSKHMLEQLEEVITLFNHIHEGMIGVFCFDQSSNHKAFAPDALVANRMNMLPHVVKPDEVRVRNGHYVEEDILGNKRERSQPMYVERDNNFIEIQRVRNSKMDADLRRQTLRKIILNKTAVSLK